MFYKLFHKLFGTDYVAVEYGGSHFTRRVKHLPNGDPYIYLFGKIRRLRKDNKTEYDEQTIPLTWVEKEE